MFKLVCVCVCVSPLRTLLIHLENGYLGKGLDQFSTHMHHYYTYVDNIYKAQKVLQVRTLYLNLVQTVSRSFFVTDLSFSVFIYLLISCYIE